MPARFPRRAVALAAGLAIAVAAVGFSAPADAAPGQRRRSPTSIAAPAPHGAANDPELQLTDIACPAAGNCWAVGTYRAGNGAHRGVLEHLTGGTWHAQTAPSPIFADSDPKVTLNVITCASIHFCVAFGTYTDATDAPQKQGLLETYERETPDADPTWTARGCSPRPAATGSPRSPRPPAPPTAPARRSARTSAGMVCGTRNSRPTRPGWVDGDATLHRTAPPPATSSLGGGRLPGRRLCSAAGLLRHRQRRAGRPARAARLVRLDPRGRGRTRRREIAIRIYDCERSTAPASTPASPAGDTRLSHGQGRGVFETRAFGSGPDDRAPVPAASATDPGDVAHRVLAAPTSATARATSDRTDAHGRQLGALLRLSAGSGTRRPRSCQHAAANPHVDLTDLACGQVAVGSYTAADGHTRPPSRRSARTAGPAGAGPLPAGAASRRRDRSPRSRATRVAGRSPSVATSTAAAGTAA